MAGRPPGHNQRGGGGGRRTNQQGANPFYFGYETGTPSMGSNNPRGNSREFRNSNRVPVPPPRIFQQNDDDFPLPQRQVEDDNWRRQGPMPQPLPQRHASINSPNRGSMNSPNRPRSKPRSRQNNSQVPQNFPLAQTQQQQPLPQASISVAHSQRYDDHQNNIKPKPLTPVNKPEVIRKSPYSPYVPPNSRTGYSDLGVLPRSIPKYENQNYGTVFYTMLDNPEISCRRNPMFQDYEKLDLGDQLEQMQRALSLTPDAKEQRLQILDNMKLILRREFPDCQIFPFGSYLTGLGDSTSDVDLYVDAFGVTAGHKLPKMGSGTQDVLEICLRCLRRAKCPNSYKAFCINTIPIREARVPILKITHWSKVNVDLSFENLTSLRNSEMIALYMKLDPCVRPLMVVIRYWAKFHSLTGSNNIKNYCLILMVLVFLVTKNIVPSVASLQKLRAEEMGKRANNSKGKVENTDIIDGWDTSFSNNVDSIRRAFSLSSTTVTKQSLVTTVLNLAKEFFEMYGNMNFNTSVVCSYKAEILPSHLFKAGNEEDLPEFMDKYKDWAVHQPRNRRLNVGTPLCVQDPFILGFNVGGVTPFGTLFKFQVACRETALVLENKVTSLLQLFIPLPKEVGDRKFLSMQDKQRMTIKLKGNVSHFIKSGEFPLDCNEEDDQHAVESHRQPLDKLIDKSTIRYGKGWETLTELKPSEEFQNLFAQTMLQHDMQSEHACLRLFVKLKALWLTILNDFFGEFWSDCFLLKVSLEERAKPYRVFADAPFSMRTRNDYEGMFRVRNKRNKKNETDVKPPLECEAMKKKLMDISEFDEKIICMKLSCSSNNAFWEKRAKIYAEIMNHLQPKEDKVRDTSSKSRQRRSPKKRTRGLDNCDPLQIQKKVTSIVLDNLGISEGNGQSRQNQSSKPLLSFTVYIKIDSSFVDDVPYVSIVFEKAGNTNKFVYSQGVSCIVEILNEVFETYTLFRLKNWINEDIGRPDEESEVSSPVKNTNSFDDKDDEEFDALMPPSPSSSTTPGDDSHDLTSLIVTGEWDKD